MAEQVDFRIGDALHLPFDDSEFDLVFLQHVAMTSPTALASMQASPAYWRPRVFC